MDDLFHSHPEEQNRLLKEREWELYSDLAVTISFLQNLAASLPIPAPRQTKGQVLGSKSVVLAIELNGIKTGLNLLDFASPLSNLVDPEMAAATLKALDKFVVRKTGTKMGFLYEDPVEDSLASIKKFCQEMKEVVTQKGKPDLSTTPSSPSTASESQIEVRKQKEKTRSSHSSFYDIAPPTPVAPTPAADNQSVLKLKAAALGVFEAIFNKSQSQRLVSVSLAAFMAAMTELKFSVTPQTGSIYLFVPAEDMDILQRPITLHRPHNANIEGHRLLFYWRRLARTYEWDWGSFESLE